MTITRMRSAMRCWSRSLKRISAHIRAERSVGRISGDEFLLVLHPLDSDEELESLIDNLLKELKEPFLIEGYGNI